MGSAVAAILQVLAIVAVAVPFVLFARHLSARRDKEWSLFAQEHGLGYAKPGWFKTPQIVGHVRGMPLDITTVSRNAGKSQITYTVAKVRIPGAVPPGFRVGRSGLDSSIAKLFGGQDIPLDHRILDDALRVRGEGEVEIARVFADPDVQEGFRTFLEAHRISRITDGQVIIEKRGVARPGDLTFLTQTAAQLAEALGSAFRAPWDTLAQDHGLVITEHGHSTVLEGTVQGLPVSIRLDRGVRQRTRIRVSLPNALPGTLQLRLAEGGGGVGLNDPVLDSMIEATSRDPDAGRRLIAAADPADDLHGHLLAVLHGHPGSTVNGHEVVLVHDHIDPDATATWLEEAVGLARALDNATGRMSDAATADDRDDAAERQRRALAARQRDRR